MKVFKALFFFLQNLVPGHEVSSVELSGQAVPLLIGAGLLHCLDLSFFPKVVLHEPQELQTLHSPSTATIDCRICVLYNYAYNIMTGFLSQKVYLL